MTPFKTLKHKTLPGTYGYFAGNPIEICHVFIPRLVSMTTTIQTLQNYYYDQPLVLEQLNDYDLITVTITENDQQ